MNKIFFAAISLLIALLPAGIVSAEGVSKDLCSYLIDVKGFSRQDCAGLDQNKNQDMFEQASQNAPGRKEQVLDLARQLEAASGHQGVNAILSDPNLHLDPALNERTFAAWLGADEASQDQNIVSGYIHWVTARFAQAKKQVDATMPDADTTAKSQAIAQQVTQYSVQLNRLADLLYNADQTAATMDGSRIRHGGPQGVNAAGKSSGQSQTLALNAAVGPIQTAAAQPPAPPIVSQPSSQTNWDAIVDKSVNPCADFYQYACGNWNKKHDIPPDQSRWGRFEELQERNRSELRQLLEDASHNPDPKDPDQKKVGDLYNACMDTKNIEAKGISSIKPEFDRISAMKTSADLPAEIAHLHQIGVPALFSFGSQADDKDAAHQISVVNQGGYSLPDRDYYLKDDFKNDLAAYQKYVSKMFSLLGDSPQEVKRETEVVLSLETALAQVSMDNVTQRDPAKVYNMQSLKEFEQAHPAFGWSNYFSSIKSPSFDNINVADPNFFEGLNILLANTSLNAVKIYLRYQVLNANADMLPKAFVQESFNFFGKTLTGEKEMKPRWKKCTILVDSLMGDALGRAYVKKYFPQASKEEALAMVQAEEKSMGEDIQGLPWMSAETKPKALSKLSQIENKIGYPDQWKDYSNLAISRTDALGDQQRATAFESQREISKIGTKTDKNEWEMTPPEVNAYYEPTQNNINFPAGILQPPFFDKNMCLAQNLGGMGAVIGHEMTHGFDDQGSQYDAQGNRSDWWTQKDKTEFKKRTACLVDEYSRFTVPNPDDPKTPVHIKGELSLGENTADNGGVRVSYMALENELAHNKGVSCGDKNWTDEKIFFLSFAQVWCGKDTPQDAKELATTDPHSPPQYRVNGVVQNMPEFAKAFSCPANSPMTPQNACRVW